MIEYRVKVELTPKQARFLSVCLVHLLTSSLVRYTDSNVVGYWQSTQQIVNGIGNGRERKPAVLTDKEWRSIIPVLHDVSEDGNVKPSVREDALKLYQHVKYDSEAE